MSNFYQTYLNYLRSAIKNTNEKTPKTTELQCLQIFHRNITHVLLTKSSDELVITNNGKQNFYLIEKQLSMKERYQLKQRTKLFDEQTLEPMHKTIKRMVSIKLEKDMFVEFIEKIIHFVI